MTKEELEQYRSIVAELDEIRDRLNNNTVSDTVTGSDSEFPYTKHSMAVSGIASEHTDDMILCRQLEQQKCRIELFVAAIPDSETRRIFRYRYIDGKVRPSWQWIAFKVRHYDESYARKKHNAYMRKGRG